MDIDSCCAATGLNNAGELDKVKYLVFYYHKKEGKVEISKDDIRNWFDERHFSQPNIARLTRKIRDSHAFIRGSAKGFYKLHALVLVELQSKYSGVHSESEEAVSDDIVLPKLLYENTRGFVESLAKQINASYAYNIYDGAAVLMRRLLEVLLILSHENLNIE